MIPTEQRKLVYQSVIGDHHGFDLDRRQIFETVSSPASSPILITIRREYMTGYAKINQLDSHAGYAWGGLRVDLEAAPAAPRHQPQQDQQVGPGRRRHAPSQPYSIEHGFGFLGIKIHSANRRFLESNNGARKSHADLGHISQPGNQVITQYQNETLDILLSMSRMDQSGSKSNPLMH